MKHLLITAGTVALLVLSLMASAHAETIYTLVKPKSDVSQTEAKKLPAFVECHLIKTGKNLAAVKAGDNIFVKAMPKNDETAFDKIDVKGTKVYRCYDAEFNHETKKIKLSRN
jgi:hypothetical protein